MRAIGTVANEQDARRLGAYLLTLGIASQMDPAPDGYCVWIRDEDKVERAKQELTMFLQNPVDLRYQTAEQLAQQVREQQTQVEQQYRRNVRDIRSQWGRPSLKSCPLTIGLIVASLGVAAASKMGQEREGILNYLFITQVRIQDDPPWDVTLPEIRQGEVWRVLTPAFIHFGPIHLLFNLWNVYNIGGVIEIRRDTWRLALLVLVTAILSNFAQWLYTHDPRFGGMSGVLYGLFGYAWMKSRYDPGVGIYLPRDVVVMMIVWLFLCMTGMVGSIANAAHVAGFVVGLVIGIAPYLWRKFRRG